MKVRSDFVTNSSSSSFVISKKYLDDDQILAIDRHISLGKKLGMYNCSFEHAWDIHETDECIGAYTTQDSFSMSSFLDYIGVHPDVVHWGYSIFDDIPDNDITDKWRKLLHENPI